MKDFLVLLLIFMIFGPEIKVYNKERVLKFKYTGILYGIIQMICSLIF